jgi:hypothetical protein
MKQLKTNYTTSMEIEHDKRKTHNCTFLQNHHMCPMKTSENCAIDMKQRLQIKHMPGIFYNPLSYIRVMLKAMKQKNLQPTQISICNLTM